MRRLMLANRNVYSLGLGIFSAMDLFCGARSRPSISRKESRIDTLQIRRLDLADRKILGKDIKDVEFSWLIGMPLVRPLGNAL